MENHILYTLAEIDEAGNARIIRNDAYFDSLEHAINYFSDVYCISGNKKIIEASLNITAMHDTKIRRDDYDEKSEYKNGDILICKDLDTGVWKLEVFHKFKDKAYKTVICQGGEYKDFLKYYEFFSDLIGTTREMLED